MLQPLSQEWDHIDFFLERKIDEPGQDGRTRPCHPRSVQIKLQEARLPLEAGPRQRYHEMHMTQWRLFINTGQAAGTLTAETLHVAAKYYPSWSCERYAQRQRGHVCELKVLTRGEDDFVVCLNQRVPSSSCS